MKGLKKVETRSVVEVRLFVLVPNTFGRAEEGRIVAISDDYDRLVDWYLNQFAEDPYRDEGFYKTFKKGSLIEYNNPCGSLKLNDIRPFGHGIHDEWVSQDTFVEIQSKFNFV